MPRNVDCVEQTANYTRKSMSGVAKRWTNSMWLVFLMQDVSLFVCNASYLLGKYCISPNNTTHSSVLHSIAKAMQHLLSLEGDLGCG